MAVWPLLRPVIARWMQNRTEDTIRRMMGMPSRKEEKKAKKRAEKEAARSNSNSRRTHRNSQSPQSPIIPKEYAEDVEFTEYREFSYKETTVTTDNKTYHESQVEDVEYKEVNKK